MNIPDELERALKDWAKDEIEKMISDFSDCEFVTCREYLEHIKGRVGDRIQD